jgi:hypothetical protein
LIGGWTISLAGSGARALAGAAAAGGAGAAAFWGGAFLGEGRGCSTTGGLGSVVGVVAAVGAGVGAGLTVQPPLSMIG